MWSEKEIEFRKSRFEQVVAESGLRANPINVRRPGPKRERIEIGASVRFPIWDIALLESVLLSL